LSPRSERISTGVPELDRVLGGGPCRRRQLVGGEPGVGNHAAPSAPADPRERRALLVTGEVAGQAKFRAAPARRLRRRRILAETEPMPLRDASANGPPSA
jgi:predicted ATP-dependent serine protease